MFKCNKKVKRSILFLVICTFCLVIEMAYQADVGYALEMNSLVFAGKNQTNALRRKEIIESLKKIMSNGKAITDEYQNTIQDYIRNPTETFKKMYDVTGRYGIKNYEITITGFGIALLSSYANNNSLDEHLRIAEDIITTIHMDITNHYKNLIYLGKIRVPYNLNWFQWSVEFTQMMAMYEYLGKNETVKYQCHQWIKRMITNLNTSFNYQRYGFNVVYLSVPRLLTNYLYDEETYQAEVNSPLFDEVLNILTITPNDMNDVKDNIYSDLSCIYHENVATYSYLLQLGGFHYNAIKTLGFHQVTAEDIVVNKLFPKLLHPRLPYITFGLYGRDKDITIETILAKNFPCYDQKVSSNYGIYILPFIGLGIFKTDKFMFSLRVQRPDIAAYESDPNNGEYALGWIQMRKLYLTEVHNRNKDIYGSGTSWQKVMEQPGVISSINGELYDVHNTYTHRASEVYKHFTEVMRSHIGHVPSKNILFWINEYKFCPTDTRHFGYYDKPLCPYDAVVHEFGVCTDNGVVLRYHIENKHTKPLRIKLIDNDIRKYAKDIHFINADSDENIKSNFVEIPPNNSRQVNWRIVFDKSKEPTSINWNEFNKTMKFKQSNMEYKIQELDRNYHAVYSTDNNPDLIGSSRSNLDDIFKFSQELIYKRDESMMYIRQKHYIHDQP